jgi:hypothetical protein
MNYFITYGDNKYKKSKKRLLMQAKEFGFQNCFAYSPNDLSESFINATRPHILQERGGGYWIWKAFILYNVFAKMRDDEIVVYLDAGCEINFKGKPRFFEYLDLLDENLGILAFHIPNCFEYMYTNQITFNYFNINSESSISNSEMLVGGVIILKKNLVTSKLVNDFYKIAIESPSIFTDQNSYSLDLRFIEHRHDQSVFSILRKKIGIQTLLD